MRSFVDTGGVRKFKVGRQQMFEATARRVGLCGGRIASGQPQELGQWYATSSTGNRWVYSTYLRRSLSKEKKYRYGCIGETGRRSNSSN